MGNGSAASQTLLRRGLGVLWLVDGLLQAQPALFRGGMVRSVLLEAAAGQPPWLRALVLLAAGAWRHAPVELNALAVVVQLALGLGILLAEGRPYRAALAASLVWALGIWVAGEGLGGMLAPGPSLATGAPGAAILYALAAALLLGDAGGLRFDLRATAAFAVGAYFALGAVLQGLPGAPALGPIVRAAARTPQPHALALAIVRAAPLASAPGGPFLLGAVSGLVAILWWHPALARHRLWAALPVLAGLWWFGMDFGVFGGAGTDPNTPPLVALLAIAATIGAPLVHRVRRRVVGQARAGLDATRRRPRLGGSQWRTARPRAARATSLTRTALSDVRPASAGGAPTAAAAPSRPRALRPPRRPAGP